MSLLNSLIYILCCVFAISLAPQFAGSAQALTIGKSEIHPFVSVKEVFTDNVFTTSTNEKRDNLTYYTPGISLSYPFSVHRFNANYSAILTRYDTYKAEKTNDQRARGVLDLKFGSRFSLSLSDVFVKDHEPRSSSTTGYIERYRNNSGTASLIYQLVDRSKVQIDYSKISWKFRDSTFRDRKEDLVAGYLYYRFLPKTSFFIEYDTKKVDFSEATTLYDNTTTSGIIGLTWEINSQSKGTIKGGRTDKKFNDPTVKDHDTWTSSIDISHEFTKYTSIMIIGQRIINESNRIGARFSIVTGGYGEVVHRFGHHLSALIHGSRGTDVYPDIFTPEMVARNDSNASGGLGLKYLVRDWIELSGDYTVRSRDSNFGAANFREHQYSVMLSATL
ncbi:MAG: outer membrane beta-barrel protein [Nitrospirota bacterium]|nr:outer membrane beta-barrel protein [Nitrospirota bacterium]